MNRALNNTFRIPNIVDAKGHRSSRYPRILAPFCAQSTRIWALRAFGVWCCAQRGDGDGQDVRPTQLQSSVFCVLYNLQ
jgi:hypothetical protein